MPPIARVRTTTSFRGGFEEIPPLEEGWNTYLPVGRFTLRVCGAACLCIRTQYISGSHTQTKKFRNLEKFLNF